MLTKDQIAAEVRKLFQTTPVEKVMGVSQDLLTMGFKGLPELRAFLSNTVKTSEQEAKEIKKEVKVKEKKAKVVKVKEVKVEEVKEVPKKEAKVKAPKTKKEAAMKKAPVVAETVVEAAPVLSYTEKVKIAKSFFDFTAEQAGKVVKDNFSKESGKKYEFQTDDEFIKALKKYRSSLRSTQPKQEVKALLKDEERFTIAKKVLPKGATKKDVKEFLEKHPNLYNDAEKYKAFLTKKLEEDFMSYDLRVQREKAKKQMRKERLEKEEVIRNNPLPKKELYLPYGKILEIVFERYFTVEADAKAWITANLTAKGLGDLVNVGYRYTFRNVEDFKSYLVDMEKGRVESKHAVLLAEMEAKGIEEAKVITMRPEARTNIIEAYEAYLKIEEVFNESLGTVVRNRLANTTWKFLVTKKRIQGKEVIRPRVGGKLVRMLLEDVDLNSVVKHFQRKNEKKTKIGSSSYFDVAAIKMYYDLAITEYRANTSPAQRASIKAITDSFVGNNVPKLIWHYLATNQSIDSFISDRYDEDEDSLELLRRHITTRYDAPLKAAAGQPKAKKAKTRK